MEENMNVSEVGGGDEGKEWDRERVCGGGGGKGLGRKTVTFYSKIEKS